MSGAAVTLQSARRRLVVDSVGIWVIAIIVGGIFGFTARQGGLSLLEAIAFSSILFAGASQFAALGLLAVNTPWPSIVLLVWLLNARHLLYSASVAPYTAQLSRRLRAGLAYLLTDEAFALTTAHIARLGRIDIPAAWYAGLTIFVPWNGATIAGWLAGAALPNPALFGLDVVFAAAMAGLAIGLVKDRAALLALVVGCVSAVAAALVVDSSAAILLGGLLGPLAGLTLYRRRS
ncbi:MAG: branched-chain amino acid ABC transporter permease [bacterium]|jgi:predicted branched-subunit amino acid permease|nr:branched-chain amino acid ABC transporter permease [Candidatus Aquidulcis sp.]